MQNDGKRLRRSLLISAFTACASVGYASGAAAAPYFQTNLVSNMPGLAELTDPALVNPWGVSESATSPFWVSDQGTNQSTLYSVTAAGISEPTLSVVMPKTASGPQGPTGQVSNSTAGFLVGNTGKPAAFIFANLNGTITAWNPSLGVAAGTPAVTEVPATGAIYTGLAIDKSTQQLYAANGNAGTIDVFNNSFQKVPLGASAFVDPKLPTGLVPFNVQEINGQIYVTYAPAGHPAQTTATAGDGVVSVFSTSGAFIKQLISGGNLASPWGVTLAPSSFGKFGGDLLVGNFSFVDSEINAFDATTGALEGTIPIDVGTGNTAGGLWDLTFGNGGSGGFPNTLYFTDGINGETGGLFGSLSVPEPASVGLLLVGIIGIAGLRRRKRRQIAHA
ncbi:MAG TPA: TIGR03118 family protein [Acetobacteraceae bacterium]|jgi:uncharacterized protein (TIGR03118 family)|nr:TIGR03118 family protein [Acetobacteraceae bacterium]